MRKIIEERSIGEKISIGVQTEEEEVGLFIASEDLSASIAFREEEWTKFVKAVKDADEKMKKLF